MRKQCVSIVFFIICCNVMFELRRHAEMDFYHLFTLLLLDACDVFAHMLVWIHVSEESEIIMLIVTRCSVFPLQESLFSGIPVHVLFFLS